jgi:hypothetical protein
MRSFILSERWASWVRSRGPYGLYPRVLANSRHPAVLGASLHDILTRLKAEPQRFPKLDLTYSPSDPVKDPVVLNLPANGIRLRFDGPEQRLRLIEVLDFTKNHIVLKPNNEKERDLVRPPSITQVNPGSPQSVEPVSGPTFRHIYHRFLGPTYAGEFVPSQEDGEEGSGTYVLSYPGVAFTFPMSASDFSSGRDNIALMSSSGSQVATSMAVFSGDSWSDARSTLWTEVLPSVKTFATLAKGKDASPDEISLVRVHGGGRLQLFRRWTEASTWITLGETTPQEIIAELGPPDAIYRKNDQKMYIHKIRAASGTRHRPNGNDLRRHDDLTDTDQSSAHTTSDDYDSNEDAVEDDLVASVSGECFYNYFYLGFDLLISTPVEPSLAPPSQTGNGVVTDLGIKQESPDRLVATKMILHCNVPGSYPFNRHRRCRWEIAYLDQSVSANSETPFTEIEEGLREEWKSVYASEDEARQRQRGMVLNRGWGDSPGSSCEFLGGWEESGRAGPMPPGAAGNGRKFDGSEDSTTTLYGFPGLVFEVLRNGFVSAVTVF